MTGESRSDSLIAVSVELRTGQAAGRAGPGGPCRGGAGTSRTTISAYEHGRKSPTPATAANSMRRSATSWPPNRRSHSAKSRSATAARSSSLITSGAWPVRGCLRRGDVAARVLICPDPARCSGSATADSEPTAHSSSSSVRAPLQSCSATSTASSSSTCGPTSSCPRRSGWHDSHSSTRSFHERPDRL